jgi:hypothetical protein
MNKRSKGRECCPSATVRPTVELVFTMYPKPVWWKVDPAWGLPLLDP